MRKAKNGDKVEVHYIGMLDNGVTFDSSGGSGHVVHSPIPFVIGEDDDLLPKFQEAVIGLEPGQSVKIKIACGDAYGPRNEEKVIVAQRSEMFPEDEMIENFRYPNKRKLPCFRPIRGDQMQLSLEKGGEPVPVVVTKVTGTTVTLDANHPLAGEDLTFDITLVNIL